VPCTLLRAELPLSMAVAACPGSCAWPSRGRWARGVLLLRGACSEHGAAGSSPLFSGMPRQIRS